MTAYRSPRDSASRRARTTAGRAARGVEVAVDRKRVAVEVVEDALERADHAGRVRLLDRHGARSKRAPGSPSSAQPAAVTHHTCAYAVFASGVAGPSSGYVPGGTVPACSLKSMRSTPEPATACVLSHAGVKLVIQTPRSSRFERRSGVEREGVLHDEADRAVHPRGPRSEPPSQVCPSQRAR